ncbi:hypothetical protein D7I43_20805 [Micromonospora globbae]|uniref:Uncharacterized protein n=1 Tax=Micromonospora globbae TaxID=1894969 RepID=A0A420EXR6_9ACTN|nr:hypothetical protein D7I43_20805 [Micromonospora globbae]
MAHLRFVLRLARRLIRSRELARSASIVFVAGLAIMAMFVTLRTLSLSGAQIADRDLGRFGASVGYGSIVLPPGENQFASDVRAQALRAGLTDFEVMLSASSTQLATTPARSVPMLEASWQDQPFPDRYDLLSGRWPTRPGEVVLTEPQDAPETADGTLPLLGGKVTFTVVGTAEDQFARSTNLLVAPGTWASLDPSLAQGFPVLGAQPLLLWSGGDAESAVTAFTTAIGDYTRRSPTVTEGADALVVGGTLRFREQLLERPERTSIERTPAGYTIPSLLLPVAAVLLVFGLNNRRFRQTSTRLVAIGVRPATAAAALAIAASAWCAAAAAAGAILGTAIGGVARAVIAQLRDWPPGPIEGLAAPPLQLLALVMLTSVGAGAALARNKEQVSSAVAPRSHPESQTTSTAQRHIRDARHLLAVAAWCATVAYAVRVDSPAKAMILTGVLTLAVLLVIPDVLELVLRVLPEGGPRRRLALRQLAADKLRAGAIVAILTVLLGASMGFLTLLDTLIRTTDQQAYPDALPGQVLLADRASSTLPPPTALLRAVDASGLADGLPRAELAYLFTTDESGIPTRSVTRDGHNGNLLAVETAGQVEQLIGHSLNPTQRAVLAEGGLLVWADAPDAPTPTTRLAVKEGDKVTSQTPELPVATVDVPLVEWRTGTDGVMLRSTADSLNLPVPRNTPLIITEVSDSAARAMQEAVGRAGIDAQAVRIYVPPKPPVPAAALLATAAGLVILVLTAVFSATRAQTRTLRGYLTRLVSIGIPPTWARHVLLYQYGILIATSTLLSLIIALPPTVVIALRISGFVLSIPWAQLLTLLTAIYLATALAALRSALSLRAREQLGTGI